MYYCKFIFLRRTTKHVIRCACRVYLISTKGTYISTYLSTILDTKNSIYDNNIYE